MPDRPRPSSELTRRCWITGAIAGTVGLSVPAEGQEAAPDDVFARLQTIARKAKIPPFGKTETEHFLSVGDAPPKFRKSALSLCEDLARSYRAHFREKGFAVDFPRDKMTVVTLAGLKSYIAFLGEDPGPDVGGHYDLDANWLVTFDFGTARRAPRAARLNTFTLVHESIHQLTYNTGMLDRHGDVPDCVSEGLATYGETWQLQSPTIGKVNKLWLDVLAKDAEWISLDELLTKDSFFREAVTQQVAYAESWVFIHDLLKSPAKTEALRKYLDAIRTRRDGARRLADAEAHFGNLAQLDRDLRKRAAAMF